MTPAMVTAVEIMLESWKSYEGQEMEVYEEFRLLTSDVISRTAFGNNYQNGKNIFEMLMSKFFKISDEIESDKPEMEIRNNIMKIIKEREEKVISGKENSFGNDFLGILVKAHHDVNDNQRISKDNLVD
nr:cytochrome P450 CYP749A22-like isoform X1 [Ziziphus jujuba var. spinosa]